MKSRLLWKLIAVNIPAIGVVFLVVWIATDYLAAAYFSTLMEKYHISPTETHHMFLDAIHRYLIQAAIVALGLAVVLSFILTRRVLRPLSQMAEVSKRIAAGDYTARVEAASRDEVGDLGLSFNRMADSLAQIEQLRKNMVADVAHELRTPLTSMRGYLEGLADGEISPSREIFEMLQSETMRLVRLVSDLMRLSRADRARASLQLDEVYLPDLINRVLETIRRELEARHLSVECNLSSLEGYIRADRDKLLQVLRNLLENACQYAPSGGQITITGTSQEGSVCLSFINDAENLADEELPLLFERFYRVDKSRSRESGGAGIGLAIVKSLVEAHGGHVDSQKQDDRLRIQITIPS